MPSRLADLVIAPDTPSCRWRTSGKRRARLSGSYLTDIPIEWYPRHWRKSGYLARLVRAFFCCKWYYLDVWNGSSGRISGAKVADFNFKVNFGLFKKLVDMLDGTYSERVIAQPPFDLMTAGGTGANRRLKVDDDDTQFLNGRQARTFREFSIPTGQTLVLRITVPINLDLLEQSVELDAGSLRITNASGGTPGGTFSETLPVIGKNNRTDRPTPLYVPQVTFEAGGTHTGGFIFDIHRAVAATATAQQRTVGNVIGDKRGVAPNTYYVRYENIGNGTATGTLWFIWEEYDV